MPGVDVDLPILLEVASRAHREPFRLAEGDVLIRAGSRPSALFLLMDGECEVVVSSVERVRVAAPTVFGEVSFVGDTCAVAEVRALGPCTVIPLEHALLLDPARLPPVEVLSVIRALTRICLDRVAGGFHPPYIALIAHDGRKDALLDFVREHRDFLRRVRSSAPRQRAPASRPSSGFASPTRWPRAPWAATRTSAEWPPAARSRRCSSSGIPCPPTRTSARGP